MNEFSKIIDWIIGELEKYDKKLTDLDYEITRLRITMIDLKQTLDEISKKEADKSSDN